MSDVGAAAGFFVGVWGAIGVAVYGVQRWHRRRWRLLSEAISAGDVERADAIWQELVVRFTAAQRGTAQLRYYEAGLLALREDWQAALATLETLAAWKQGAEFVSGLRARCLAELGRTDDAIALAEATLTKPGLRRLTVASVRTTVGIVQLKRGEFARALTTLDEVAATSPANALLATVSFYRGEALRALGRFAEALQAYERTVAVVPLSRRAAHARERLRQSPPNSYR
jgi:tetratricopeptide (TPR) repeat protein